MVGIHRFLIWTKALDLICCRLMVAAVGQHYCIERSKFEHVGGEADGLDDREDVAFNGVPGRHKVIHPNQFVDQVHPDANEG